MNNCEEKIRLSCPPGLFSKCVRTELTPPSFSTLVNACNSTEDVDVDQYILIGQIKEELDLSALVSDCQSLPLVKNVKTLIQLLLDKACSQQEDINFLTSQIALQENKIAALQNNICPQNESF